MGFAGLLQREEEGGAGDSGNIMITKIIKRLQSSLVRAVPMGMNKHKHLYPVDSIGLSR